MLEAKNDFHFAYLTLKSIISFQLRVFINSVLRGHFFLKSNINNYLKKNKKPMLHLGSSINLNGFFNSQILGKNPINISRKLPFENNSFEIIFSSHLVEHLHLNEIINFLLESKRILKKGGIQIIATPSIQNIYNISFSNNYKNKKIHFEKGKKIFKIKDFSGSHNINVSMRAYGHRFVFDHDFLEIINKKVTYSKVQEINVSQIRDNEIRTYLKKKPPRWKLESKIFMLTK